MSLTEKDIQDNFVHVGGLKNKRNPKTAKYQQKENQKGFVFFDPKQIITQLEHSKKRIQQAKKSNKEILLVSEKALFADDVKELATKNGFHYMNYKMPAGFVTNFATLKGRIEYLNKQKSFVMSNAYTQVTKKEKSMIKRKLSKIEKVYEGVLSLNKEPEFIIVIDGSQMENLTKEIKKTSTENILMVGSNFNKRRTDDSLLTINLQSYRSVKFVLDYLLR